MNKSKSKSLGRIAYPKFEIRSFNGRTGEIVLKVADYLDKKIYLEMSIHQVDRLIAIVHALIEKYQEHINFEQAQCRRLKDKSPYRGK